MHVMQFNSCPIQNTLDIKAFELIDAVFYNCVVLNNLICIKLKINYE